MSDLQQLQTAAKQHRESLEKTQLDLLKAKAELVQVQRALAEWERYARDLHNDDGMIGRQKRRLEERRDQLQAEIKTASATKERLKAADLNFRGRFFEQPDPVSQLAALADDSPILLMPLRLETRFKQTEREHQLWLRIYPDECHINNFEPLLSEYELQQAKSF